MIKPALQDDAFLNDIESATSDPSNLYLWWLGQSGFLIQFHHDRFLVDPYLSDTLTKKYANTDKPHVRMSELVVDPARLKGISVITVSHGHTDHLDADTLQAIRNSDLKEDEPCCPLLVAPIAIAKLAEERWGTDVDRRLDEYDVVSWGNDVRITAIASAHETVERNERGRCLYLGYVFHFGRFTIYHSGDTVLYDGLAERLKPFNIDVALLPINGCSPERRVAGNLSGKESAQLAKAIGAKLVIPCHYDMFEFNTADPADEFIPECQRLGQPYRILKLGERWSSTELENSGPPLPLRERG